VDPDISLDYGLTLLAALLIGAGFVLQQQSAQREPASRFLSLRLISDLLRQPRWLAGIAAMIGGQILAAWSIGNLSLAFVEPLLTTNLVFALLLAVPIAKASLRFWEIAGAAVLCTGVALLSASRSAKPIGLSFGSVTHWPAAAVIAGLAFAAVYQGRLHPGRARAMLTGAAAGLIFGIQDALTRQTLEILGSNGVGAMFTTWAPYALVGAGATGIWLMQSAFNSGPLPLSLPAIAAGEPLVGLLLGIVVFGDRIQITPGELALQAAGIVALIAGVIMVGRAPALSHLRTWSPPALPHITGALPALPGRAARQARHPGESQEPGPRDPGTRDPGGPQAARDREAGPLLGLGPHLESGTVTDPGAGGREPANGDVRINRHPAPAPRGSDEAAERPQPLPRRSQRGASRSVPRPQIAALNTVMQNSTKVTMCTPVQYSQMSLIW
jgi:drug/metabolite transporter (DMT)-like permease